MMFQEGENVPRPQLISDNRRQKSNNFGVCRFVEGYLLDKYTLHMEGLFVKHIRNYQSTNGT